ncbi:hypothetical protein [Chryseobacterium sp. ISL-6]|uniref:hypothetical protein n=1 Tax=Chryseobacterium sp. ISL-6 TaxID=2819143 RepID=UPI001BE6F2D3|nr:hypothetical protein [Chryseobacterium sp. ISL-6]MBT2621969.1 hypothetical protein [Chryseobacterium sp. ISL-6]
MKRSQIVIIVSLAIFIISLTQTAVYTKGNEMHAFACFLLGWMDLFGEGVAWLANPLFFIALFFLLLKQVKISTVFSFLAICMSLYYLSAESITVDEAGHKSPIVSYGLGYYLWIASGLSLFIGNLILLRSPLKVQA